MPTSYMAASFGNPADYYYPPSFVNHAFPPPPPSHPHHQHYHQLQHHQHHHHPPPPPPATTFYPSRPMPPPPPPPHAFITTDQELCDYLYHMGFVQGACTDTVVTVGHCQKEAHALMLGRSPKLQQLLSAQGKKKKKQLSLGDAPLTATEEVVHTAIAHFYRPLHQQDILYLFARPRTLLGLLDFAAYLELHPLCAMIYDALNHEWTLDTIVFWLPYLELGASADTASVAHATHFLTAVLPAQLDAFGPDNNYIDLAHVYAHLPLPLLKRCIEHEKLTARDPMQRLHFAKQVLALRDDDGTKATLRFDDGNVSVMLIPAQST
ncbi:hypothetical protein BC940DRAFT_305501 [Gongronella butleri]|nr:hypothetical protein BC940DRAFT_305501 [Gongronella butleri]